MSFFTTNKMVLRRNGIDTTYYLSNSVLGYLNQIDGKFYEDSLYTTELEAVPTLLYIDITTNNLYRYNEAETAYIVISGGGGGDAIVYVNALPATNIRNVIYGIVSYANYTKTVADSFLDSDETFLKAESGTDYTYTTNSEVQASTDGTSFKTFLSLDYDSQNSEFTLTYTDNTSEVLVDGDAFYYKITTRNFFAGNATEQIIVPLASGGGGGSSSTYTQGVGISIENGVISVIPATTTTLGGVKVDNKTIKVNESGEIRGDYEGGYGINVTNNIIKTNEFVGTQAEWDALAPNEQAAFDQVNIIDGSSAAATAPGHVIKDSSDVTFPQRTNLKFENMSTTDDSANDVTKITPIPYTAGSKIDITNYEISCDESVRSTFVGTKAEWDALTAAQKAEYELVNITDDVANGGMTVVDTIANGNLNPCTSNSVYSALQEKNKLVSILNAEVNIFTNRYETTVSNITDYIALFIKGYVNNDQGGLRFATIAPIAILFGNLDYNVPIETNSIHNLSLIVNATSSGGLQIAASGKSDAPAATKIALTQIKALKG